MATLKVDDRIPSGELHRHLGVSKGVARVWRLKGVFPQIHHHGPKSYYSRLELVRLVSRAEGSLAAIALVVEI